MSITCRKLDPQKEGVWGWIAHPDAPGRHPGVLMLHHAPGLTGDYKSNAALLAQRGFTVLIPNLFNMVGVPGDHHMGQGPAIQAQHGDAEFLAAIGTAWKFLAGRADTDPERIAAVGHCMGGRLGIPFAADTPALKALILYYATIRDELVTPQRPRHSFETAKQVRCATQVIYGGSDHLTPNAIQLKLWQSFLEGGTPLEWHFLAQGNHGFANPDSEGYQPELAQLSNDIATEFLVRTLMR